MNIELKYLLTRAIGSVTKLGVCAIAPLASTKVFYSDQSAQNYAEVLLEATGVMNPKVIAFIGCSINVIAHDLLDAAEWVINNEIPSKVVDYFSDKFVASNSTHIASNDTYTDESWHYLHMNNDVVPYGDA